MKRRKKSLSELPDDKLPRPVRVDSIDGKMPRIKIRLHPKIDELIAEAKKRGLKLKNGKFVKNENRK